MEILTLPMREGILYLPCPSGIGIEILTLSVRVSIGMFSAHIKEYDYSFPVSQGKHDFSFPVCQGKHDYSLPVGEGKHEYGINCNLHWFRYGNSYIVRVLHFIKEI